MQKIKLVLEDGSEKEFDSGITAFDIARDTGKELNNAIAIKLDGSILDLSAPIKKDGEIKFLTTEDKEGLSVLRHSTSHVMAAAVKELFPDVKVAIGPSIEEGFYYDFDKAEPFVPEDIEKIEAKMKEIISSNTPFARKVLSKDEAIEFFTKLGEPYKVEIIKEIPAETVSIYETGNFVDLCTGPHIPSTKKIKVYKLLNVAGAYWRGDEKKKMLQRIYGTAFNTKEELKEFLTRREEAQKRDHRKLGKELDLYSIQEEAGPGLIYWHPKGAAIRRVIENFWVDEHYKRGYQLIYTPHIARAKLWEISGHLNFYRENMYSPMDIEGQEYLIKPMNCPGHILIYRSKRRSYRDLPMRYAELGTVYRYERSGVLHGTLRVRGFTQDDAHIFCTMEQLKSEMSGVMELVQFMLSTFGFNEYDVNLATRPEKFAGKTEDWDMAEGTCAQVLKEMNIPYTIDEGGAVFYGPKIDIKIRDVLGRQWQGPTIQFDFNLPEKFDAIYIGQDGKEHYVVMVHRAVLGSFERFFGCLIEHYAGAFPVWLAPVQAAIMPIADRNHEYALSLKKILEEKKIRVDIDLRNEKVGFKIREAQKEKIPYMLIVGDKEEEEKKISVRSRAKGDEGPTAAEDFLSRITEEIEKRV